MQRARHGQIQARCGRKRKSAIAMSIPANMWQPTSAGSSSGPADKYPPPIACNVGKRHFATVRGTPAIPAKPGAGADRDGASLDNLVAASGPASFSVYSRIDYGEHPRIIAAERADDRRQFASRRAQGRHSDGLELPTRRVRQAERGSRKRAHAP